MFRFGNLRVPGVRKEVRGWRVCRESVCKTQPCSVTYERKRVFLLYLNPNLTFLVYLFDVLLFNDFNIFMSSLLKKKLTVITVPTESRSKQSGEYQSQKVAVIILYKSVKVISPSFGLIRKWVIVCYRRFRTSFTSLF